MADETMKKSAALLLVMAFLLSSCSAAESKAKQFLANIFTVSAETTASASGLSEAAVTKFHSPVKALMTGGGYNKAVNNRFGLDNLENAISEKIASKVTKIELTKAEAGSAYQFYYADGKSPQSKRAE